MRELLDLIYPMTCCSCQRKLLYKELAVCDTCVSDLSLTHFESSSENLMEQLFKHHDLKPMASARFFFEEDGPVQGLLHGLKYQYRKDAAKFLGLQMAKGLRQAARFVQFTALVPVPLHFSKQFSRSYNQSELIARAMADSLKMEVLPQALKRVRRTPSQTRLDREERLKNVHQAFRPGSLKGHKQIILVDDVATTGSTLHECAKALRSGGAEKIWLATAAIAIEF